MVVNRTSLWSALSSTALISLAPNLILLLFPKFGAEESPQEHAILLSLGQSLAAGGLLGDVFLHALPDAKDEDDLELVGLRVLIGFGVFLCLDVLMRSMGGDDNMDHRHHHQHNSNHTTTEGKDNKSTLIVHRTTWQLFFTSSVLLNLAADSLHNLTDGMAIGAAFAATSSSSSHHDPLAVSTAASWITSRGGLATLSILFHEIPHELGDFCVLVRAGFTRNQAISLQFVTAIAAMIGSVLGVYCVELFGEALVHVTAGGFVYLSTVTLLPSVLEMQPPCSFRWRLAQLVAFFAGVGLMYSVVLLEGDDHNHSHGGQHDHHHKHLPSSGDAHSEL